MLKIYIMKQEKGKVKMEERQNIPSEYKVLLPWAYFGYNLLFAIPLIGFILAIVLAFDNSNLNRRNFARAYFCGWILIAMIAIITLVISMVTGVALYTNLKLY